MRQRYLLKDRRIPNLQRGDETMALRHIQYK